jgi:hypothetical protein
MVKKYVWDAAKRQWLRPVILATQEAEIRRIVVGSRPVKIVFKTLSQKYPTQNTAGEVTRVLECLPSKCEALHSNPRDHQKKKKRIWDV